MTEQHEGSVMINGKWVCDGCGKDPCRCHWHDERYEPEEDVDVDVCQHCGGYFAWSPQLTAAWREHWKPNENERQPQRCHRCIVNDTWFEDREDAR